ncbi:hypothetical protein TSUD_201400 [Trifolium subterraneum]|uniref:SCP domain-containing protein n=1 Tax=Trifolium subterraneum TaxID=3900 RepID=A0A2Z6LTW9_TRISU|nr:hypothetical protein TSUD_201400 [Trifolium subterraneum]
MKPHLLLCFFVFVITFTTKTLSTSPQSSSSSTPTQMYEQYLSQQKKPDNDTIYKVSKQLCWGCMAESVEFLFRHNLVRATKWELPLMWDFQLEQYARCTINWYHGSEAWLQQFHMHCAIGAAGPA